MEKRIVATLKLLGELGFDEIYLPPSEEKTKSNQKEDPQQKPPLSEVKGENKVILRKELYEKNKNCCRCELCKSRTQIVFYDGNPDSPVMFVGEAPGEEEDKQGKPFVGRAGQYLNKVLKEIGLPREKIYIPMSANVGLPTTANLSPRRCKPV
jgi:DNA polymerase